MKKKRVEMNANLQYECKLGQELYGSRNRMKRLTRRCENRIQQRIFGLWKNIAYNIRKTPAIYCWLVNSPLKRLYDAVKAKVGE